MDDREEVDLQGAERSHTKSRFHGSEQFGSFRQGVQVIPYSDRNRPGRPTSSSRRSNHTTYGLVFN